MIVADAEAVGGERAKILDFGIAKAQSTTEAPETGSVKTRTGALMGTPRYMSPEQCRGSGAVTGKSDVYSLGVMLYEMVGGRPLMQAQAAGELIAMHIYLVPPSLREVDPSLPAELTQLVDSMLAKNAEDRPAMTEVVKQLEQLGAQRSIPPPPASLPGTATASSDKAPAVSPSFPDVVAGMLATPTTLRAAAAQAPPPPPVTRRSVNPYMLVAIVATAVAAVVSVELARRPAAVPVASAPPAPVGKPAQPAVVAPPPAAVAPKVHWRLSSQPTGAQVIRASDGQVLGTTPWQSERAAGTDKVQLVLRLSGFTEKNVELSENADAERSEALQPVRAAPAPEPRSRSKRHGGSRSSSAGKSSSEEISDDELRIVK